MDKLKLVRMPDGSTRCPCCGGKQIRLMVKVWYEKIPFTVGINGELEYAAQDGKCTGIDEFEVECNSCYWQCYVDSLVIYDTQRGEAI